MLEIRQLRRAGSEPSAPELIKATDLAIGRSECVAVSGPSGAGKSLLMRAIADLDPNDGDITLDGVSRDSMPAPEWRRQVIYQPAESGWWADVTGEHFTRSTALEDLLAAFALPADILASPVSRLSTGERQRLALIRTLVLAPRVMLLDEPTSGLDSEAVERVEGVLRQRLDAGAAIAIVTHDAEQAARLAGRLYRMADGELFAAGESAP